MTARPTQLGLTLTVAVVAVFVARQRTLQVLRAGNDSLRQRLELENSASNPAVGEAPTNSFVRLGEADQEELLRLRGTIAPLLEQLRDASNRVVVLQRLASHSSR